MTLQHQSGGAVFRYIKIEIRISNLRSIADRSYHCQRVLGIFLLHS